MNHVPLHLQTFLDLCNVAQVANYTQPLELLDTMDNEKRTNIVFKAVRKNTITLMTKAYGRGTGMHRERIIFIN